MVHGPKPGARNPALLPPPIAATSRSFTPAKIDYSALRQWSATGVVKRTRPATRKHRRYRLGRWHSRSASSWNPPNDAVPAEELGVHTGNQSRRSLVSIDICRKPSESQRSSIGSIHSPPVTGNSASFISDDDFENDYGFADAEGGPLAQMLLRENDEIWNHSAYRFTFYSPVTGTVRSNDVRTLTTDSADGLDALMRQALHSDRGGRGKASAERTGGRRAGEAPAVGAAVGQPPQLSVTSVDSLPRVSDHRAGGSLAPDQGLLHPNYARGEGRKSSPRSPPTSPPPEAQRTDLPGDDDRPKLFWLDVMNPTEDEITALAQVFDLHPLTAEELLLAKDQGLTQDSFKSFRHYDVICYRTSSVAAAQSEANALDSHNSPTGRTSLYSTGDEKEQSFVCDFGQPAERPGIADATSEQVPGLRRRIKSLFSRPPEHDMEVSDLEVPERQQQHLKASVAALALTEAPEAPGDDALDEPVAFYVIVMAEGIVTLHHGNVAHVRNTVARLKLDEELVWLTPDYVSYLLLDDITDTLVPTTRLLELEVDAIDELVLILTRAEHDDVLKRIGIERRHALWLVRLLHGKAEVLRAVERRVHAKAHGPSSPRRPRPSGAQALAAAAPVIVVPAALDDSADNDSDDSAGSDSDALASQWLTSDEEEGDLYGLSRRTAAPRPCKASDAQGPVRPDVTKYLADVHDHLISLTASVHHCERILARAHGNYLARINLELTHASNTTNQLATQMTVLAGLFLPMNLVAGLWGMNVKVPGRDRDDLRDFALIVGAMGIFILLTLGFCRWRRII
ncbi:CorA metal ion transporter [Coemansia sp. RSA 552]|nr:CorA metal ion transporter [Coemansia sp. RSA 552]